MQNARKRNECGGEVKESKKLLSQKLLDLLIEGPKSKEQLIRSVYGVKKGHKFYHVYRRNLNKMISRLRDDYKAEIFHCHRTNTVRLYGVVL